MGFRPLGFGVLGLGFDKVWGFRPLGSREEAQSTSRKFQTLRFRAGGRDVPDTMQQPSLVKHSHFMSSVAAGGLMC